jgi:hypothetical protein
MALATKISIINLALTAIGADRITAIGTADDTELAQKANAVWDFCLQEVLVAHRWKFATKRSSLARLSSGPDFGYNYAFQLPTGYVRAIDPSPRDVTYTIEDNKVYYNDDTFYLRYIAYISDPSKFSIGFTLALAAKIAATIAFSVSNSMTVAQAAEAQYTLKLSQGKSMDAQEGGTPDEIVEEDPAEARG